MTKNPQEFADLLGVEIVGEVPDVDGGPFGIARLARLMHQRLVPSHGERPGRPTDSRWTTRPKVPMSEATQRHLAEIAEAMSTPGIRVSPMQVAAQLLEEALRQVRVPVTPSIQNPWERLPQEAPFVLSEDAARIATFNKSAPAAVRLHLDVLPEPFIGRRDALVVLLNLNPGYTAEGPRIHSDPSFADRVRRNLTHQPAECPFYLLDPAVTGPGRDWWELRLGRLIKQIGRQSVANGVLCVEYLPYHSRRFRHGRLVLPSQQYSFSLMREALERKAVVILLRGRRLWFRAVPELQSYQGLYTVKNWRKPTVSPGNCPGGYERAVEVLEAGARGTAGEIMDPQDMLVEVERLLQRFAGAFGGRRHYRTIRLRDGRVLGVNVFGHGYSRGHVRVHVRDVARDEALRVPRTSAPSVPALLPHLCPRCADIPAVYPDWYPGPREDGNRAFYGFQWHRPDGLNRADLALVGDCVRWLLGHFPLP